MGSGIVWNVALSSLSLSNPFLHLLSRSVQTVSYFLSSALVRSSFVILSPSLPLFALELVHLFVWGDSHVVSVYYSSVSAGFLGRSCVLPVSTSLSWSFFSLLFTTYLPPASPNSSRCVPSLEGFDTTTWGILTGVIVGFVVVVKRERVWELMREV